MLPESLAHRLESDLQKRSREGLLRSMRTVVGAQKESVRIGDFSLINLGGNNPLGLAANAEVLSFVITHLPEYGSGAGASRLISGNLSLHQTLERQLALFKETEAALVFPSGYMANIGVVTALVEKNDLVFFDKLCHASLVDGAKLSGAKIHSFPHRNYSRLVSLLERMQGSGERFVLTDTLFSMDGDLADLHRLVTLCEEFKVTLIVDEAHATGVLGPRGRGALEGTGLESRIPVITGTLSKALGSQGGFVCGSSLLIQSLINRSRPFIFTTGLNPAAVLTAMASLEWISKHPGAGQRAIRSCRRVYDSLTEMGFQCSPPGFEGQPPAAHILPVILGEAAETKALEKHLLSAGILAPAVRPPAVPRGSCRLRLSFMIGHNEAVVEEILEAFSTYTSAHR